MNGERAGMRRRVTDIPRENVNWFIENSLHDRRMARELARAELTARRDGYVFRWVIRWFCQLLEPGNEEIAIATAHAVILDGAPGTDPRAPKVERQLMRTAGRDGPDGPGCVIRWERARACQLFEPDGKTLIDQDNDSDVDPAADPLARVIAAELALEAGI